MLRIYRGVGGFFRGFLSKSYIYIFPVNISVKKHTGKLRGDYGKVTGKSREGIPLTPKPKTLLMLRINPTYQSPKAHIFLRGVKTPLTPFFIFHPIKIN
jgi:hypothetical protein